MKNSFDEDYFERGLETGKSCYSNYRWIPELTIPLAVTLMKELSISDNDKVMDVGCAKGYLVKAFRLIHIEAYGCDVSEYAISNCPKDVASYLYLRDFPGSYDWIICKDVLEHISYKEIDPFLQNLKTRCGKMFCVIPLGEGGKYTVPAYNLDPTHIIRESLEWWSERFAMAGFVVQKKSYKMKHVKENWEQYERGNGFYVLSSNGAV